MIHGQVNPTYFTPEDDHDCDRNVTYGDETGLCSKCRDHAEFCQICKNSLCCGYRELTLDYLDVKEF